MIDAAGVHVVEMPLGRRVNRLYVFHGPRQALLFDVGCDGDVSAHVVPSLEAAGIDRALLRWAVVSHGDVDHFGGLADARDSLPAVRTAVHRADAHLAQDVEVYLSERAREFAAAHAVDESDEAVAWTRQVARTVPVDLQLSGGERIDLGDRTVELLHVPGHSHGHLAVWDADTGCLAVSDAVLGEAVPLADGSPSFPPTYRYVDEYLRTVARLRALPFRWLLTAHYPLMDAAAGRDFLDVTEDFTRRLDRLVRTSLRTPTSLSSLLRRIGPLAGDWPSDGTLAALAQPVVGHLERLQAAGVVVQDRSGDVPVFSLAAGS